jgi:hypothetical protein
MKRLPEHTALRKRLLRWHYHKASGPGILDLLESGYQKFRHDVSNRLEKDIDYRTALKVATLDELRSLQWHIDEDRIEKQMRRNYKS